MARKTKASGQNSKPTGPVIIEDAVEDAVEIAQTDADAADTANDTMAEAAVSEVAETVEAAPEMAEPDSESIADDSPQEDVDTAPEAEISDDEPALSEPEPEVEPEPTAEMPEPVPAPVPPEVTVQKVGFVPLVLGGAIAAALGFGAAWYYFGQQGDDLSVLIAEQSAQITALEEQAAALAAQVAEIPTEAPDLTPLEGRITASEEALGGVTTDVATRIAAFDERLTAVERAPETDGTLAETAIASWQMELDALRAEIEAQQARMGDIATTAEADLEASRAAAAAVEAQAEAAAAQAIARAALARIQVALDAGTPFDAALADLAESGIEPPEALASVAAEGVPTLGTLREGFPEAARAALAAARAEGVADVDTNPVTAFLRNQFDVRSVAPREGDDPDAILSRVAAALNENRLTDALAEIEGLPEVARAGMSDWLGLADARAAATAAVETLDQPSNN